MSFITFFFFFLIKVVCIFKSPNQPSPLQADIVQVLAGEASRKINAIYTNQSSVLQRENQDLKAKAGELESKLQDITKDCEKAQLWRENVLNGCPVLFEETGMIFTLKLFGQLMRNTEKLTEEAPGSSSTAEVQSGNDAGMFL